MRDAAVQLDDSQIVSDDGTENDVNIREDRSKCRGSGSHALAAIPARCLGRAPEPCELSGGALRGGAVRSRGIAVSCEKCFPYECAHNAVCDGVH